MLRVTSLDTIREQRNKTDSQKKNSIATKEGTLVNSAIKNDMNLEQAKKTYLISDEVEMPIQLFQNKVNLDKKLLPLSGISLGIMSIITGLTWFVNRSAKIAKETTPEKWLPTLTRNVNLNEENSQVVYQMLQSPNRKTFIAGVGVLALSTMAFMGKTFFDGYKEIWVKRKDVNIQKNLQENLISVETESFSGKMQIIRSLMSKYTNIFEKYLKDSNNEKVLQNFEKNLYSNINFTSQNKNMKKTNQSNLGNIFLGFFTTLGIIGLGFLSFKNLSKSKVHLNEGLNRAKETIKELVKTSDENTKQVDKNNLEHMFTSLEGSDNIETFITEQINNLNWVNKKEKQEFLDKVIKKINTSTTKVNPNIGGDGTPKPAFNSFVNDYKAFFYNWLIDTANPQFKQLFFGITGITAISYCGKLMGDAIKEVQVKKINAQTELELQKRLVSTELRNFESKKNAAIKPLVDEFFKKADSQNVSKEDLKKYAENILFEIKNGPPYVYS